MNAATDEGRVVYWHRELPPLGAEIAGEGSVEAASGRVRGTLAGRDRLWHNCLHELRATAETRVAQEVRRLNARYAHVLNETVDTRRDDAAGEAWLHGRFDFVLLRTPDPAVPTT